jgi:hypothetical protein
MNKDTKKFLWIGAGIAALWYLWKNSASAATPAATPGTGVPMPTPSTGTIAPAPTASQVTAASTVFDSLPDAQGPSSGYVIFPSGSMSASVFLPFKQGPGGALYTTWAGGVFSIGSANANGDYPATQVQ